MPGENKLSQISVGLGILGFVAGLFASFAVLSGDELGRVNLLFLLLLYAFLPVVGLILSLLFLLKKDSKGLAGWILELPLWSRRRPVALLILQSTADRKPWLFLQTQILALGFALGGLLIYFLLLLGSDVSFVWRSTVLQATDVLPLLNLLALPWLFWPEAQASLELLQQSQDFRLTNEFASGQNLGLWWKYIFAVQLTYNLLPRSIMLLIARVRYQTTAKLAHSSSGQGLSTAQQSTENPVTAASLAAVVHALPGPYTLIDWAAAPQLCHLHLSNCLGTPLEIIPVDSEAIAMGPQSISDGQTLVILVKSWEPPLAELSDYLLAIGNGDEKYLLPLDWSEQAVKHIRDVHLDEWRRFCSKLNSSDGIENWQVLQTGKPS